MAKYKHTFWRYVPSTEKFKSEFKFVESIESDSDAVPEFHDHYCIDQVIDLVTGQMRVKNHSAPEYCVSKYVGFNLCLPPVEKANKQEIYVVIHRSSFSHKKIGQKKVSEFQANMKMEHKFSKHKKNSVLFH